MKGELNEIKQRLMQELEEKLGAEEKRHQRDILRL